MARRKADRPERASFKVDWEVVPLGRKPDATIAEELTKKLGTTINAEQVAVARRRAGLAPYKAPNPPLRGEAVEAHREATNSRKHRPMTTKGASDV